jgi:hypothetical protein
MLRQSPGSQRIRSFTLNTLYFVVFLVIPFGAHAEVETPDTPGRSHIACISRRIL